MERLTFEGNFCDIALCRENPCPYDGQCTQRQVWERLKDYEDTDLPPQDLRRMLEESANEGEARRIRLGGLLAAVALDGAKVTITPDCWPVRGKVATILVSMTRQSWNGNVTLNRSVPVEGGTVEGGTVEAVEKALAETVENMVPALDAPFSGRG